LINIFNLPQQRYHASNTKQRKNFLQNRFPHWHTFLYELDTIQNLKSFRHLIFQNERIVEFMAMSLNKACGIHDDDDDNDDEDRATVPIQAKSEFIKSIRTKISEIYLTIDPTSDVFSFHERNITK